MAEWTLLYIWACSLRRRPPHTAVVNSMNAVNSSIRVPHSSKTNVGNGGLKGGATARTQATVASTCQRRHRRSNQRQHQRRQKHSGKSTHFRELREAVDAATAQRADHSFFALFCRDLLPVQVAPHTPLLVTRSQALHAVLQPCPRHLRMHSWWHQVMWKRELPAYPAVTHRLVCSAVAQAVCSAAAH